jgi:cytoskeletal protein CcmA (bactofilin family)
VVEGNVSTREAIIGGRVHGSVSASERIEIQAEAVVEGDLMTPRLLVQEGGRVNGGVRMETVSSE